MKKFIVTTTINPPTEAIEKFDAMPDWELIVIGDLKTPTNYRLKRGQYVTPTEQEKFDPELSEAIGWNCIQRRNFGFLIAAQNGADIIATIDDDNNPMPNWGKNLMIGKPTEVNYYTTTADAFDPVGATNHPALWHRGFPLQILAKRDYADVTKKTITPDVQADFWNGDPDIDAICRMEHAPECSFDAKAFPLASNKISPFNSQNTFLRASLLPDYFMYPGIGRMDDIWAAYYLQTKGVNVVYGEASVFHERNIHNLTEDMKLEYRGYENSLPLVQGLKNNPDSIRAFLPEKALRAWELYRKHFALTDQESLAKKMA